MVFINFNSADIDDNKEPNTIASIYARYWHIQPYIHIYIDLIHHVPYAKDQILNYLKNIASNQSNIYKFDVNIDIEIFNLIISSLLPNKEHIYSYQSYIQWMNIIQVIKPLLSSLLINIQNNQLQINDISKTEVIISKYQKILFYYIFIRDLSIPLKIKSFKTLEIFNTLIDISLQSQQAFRSILYMLSELNRSYSRNDNIVECGICLDIPTEPVRFCQQCKRLW